MRILSTARLGIVLLVLGVAVFSMVDSSIPREARAQTISRVYLDPVVTRDVAPGPSSTIAIGVRMDLAAGERINAFDVRVNYMNWGSVVDALNLDSSNNLFATQNPAVLAACADGVSQDPNIVGCQTDDSPSGGQVHFAQGVVGTTVSGERTNQLLFSIQFAVNGTGTSLFVLDRANLLNPGPDQYPNPHYVQAVTRAGVFGNSGVVAFFDFEPPVLPAILAGHNVTFDAGASFRAGVTGVQFAYNWSFGDGTPDETRGPIAYHVFRSPGRFRVQLSVTDTADNLVGRVERTVVVSPALGTLQISVKNQQGTPLRWNVQVLLFNSSASTVPVHNKTIDGAGVVMFDRLSPGGYVLRFSGPTLLAEENRQLEVIGGWTSLETVYLAERVISPPEQFGGLVLVGGILGGLGIVGTALIWQRRSQRKNRAGRMPSGKPSRDKRRFGRR